MWLDSSRQAISKGRTVLVTKKRVDIKIASGGNRQAKKQEHRDIVTLLLWAIGVYGKSRYDLRPEPQNRGIGNNSIIVTKENGSYLIFAVSTGPDSRQLYYLEPAPSITIAECANRIKGLSSISWQELGKKNRLQAQKEWEEAKKAERESRLKNQPKTQPKIKETPAKEVSISVKDSQDASKALPPVSSSSPKILDQESLSTEKQKSEKEKKVRLSKGTPWTGISKDESTARVVVRSLHKTIGDGILWMTSDGRASLVTNLPAPLAEADPRSISKGLSSLASLKRDAPVERHQQGDSPRPTIGFSLTDVGRSMLDDGVETKDEPVEALEESAPPVSDFAQFLGGLRSVSQKLEEIRVKEEECKRELQQLEEERERVLEEMSGEMKDLLGVLSVFTSRS